MTDDPDLGHSTSSLHALAATKGDFLARDGHIVALGALAVVVVAVLAFLAVLVAS